MGILEKLTDFVSDNAPLLLAGVAVAGLGLTVYEAIKAGEEETEKEEPEEVKEQVKRVAKKYAKPITLAAVTGVCIVGSAFLSKKQQVELLGSYLVLEQGFYQYKDKVKELFGLEEEMKVRHEVAKDNAIKQLHPLEDVDDGLFQFYDEMSHRYFRDTMDNVVNAENRLNDIFSIYPYIDQNKFYELIDNEELPPTDDGAMNGWSHWQGETNYGHRFIEFQHETMEVDGMECTYIHPTVGPYADYMW